MNKTPCFSPAHILLPSEQIPVGQWGCVACDQFTSCLLYTSSQQGEWCQFVFTLPATPPNPSGMKRLPDESGQPVPVEDPASMKPVN